MSAFDRLADRALGLGGEAPRDEQQQAVLEELELAAAALHLAFRPQTGAGMPSALARRLRRRAGDFLSPGASGGDSITNS